MRWPWVSRTAYDDLKERSDKVFGLTWDEMHKAQVRCAELTHELLVLKRDGFSPPPQAGPISPAVDLPVSVAEAIHDSTHGLPSDIKRTVLQRAVQALQAGKQADEVAVMVRNGDRAPR